MKTKMLTERETIYTTGAYLKPVKIGEYYHWVVVAFKDDTYYGGDCISLKVESKEPLIIEF